MMKIYFLTKKKTHSSYFVYYHISSDIKKDGRESCLVVMMKSKKDFDTLHDRYYSRSLSLKK